MTEPKSRIDQIIDRALAAEEENERLAARCEELTRRLLGALDADPTTASQALSWVGRAEQAEKLLDELLRYIRQRSLDTSHFPPGWVARAMSQMKAVEILKRDQAALAERPPDDDYWQTLDRPNGGQDVWREARARIQAVARESRRRPLAPNLPRDADGTDRRRPI